MNKLKLNKVKENAEFEMFKDDRTDSFEAYTVTAKDGTKKVNVKLTFALLHVADIESRDLEDDLFVKSVEFLKSTGSKDWEVILESSNALQYSDINIPDFVEYAKEK